MVILGLDTNSAVPSDAKIVKMTGLEVKKSNRPRRRMRFIRATACRVVGGLKEMPALGVDWVVLSVSLRSY
jgi:hypothetical protein